MSNSTSDLSHDQIQSLDFLLVSVFLSLVLLTAHAAHLFNKPYFTETGAIIVLGIAVGGILKLIDDARDASDSGGHKFSYIATARFQHDTFLNIILPLIILEAGYSLQHTGILRNLGACLILAIPGTLISTMIIGGIIYGWAGFALPALSDLGIHGLFLSMTFASALSATDPVSVICLLSSMFDMTREPPLLYNLIFAEATMNDAVAIVLFEVFEKYIDTDITGVSFILAILNFIKVFLLSSLLGYVVGLLLALLFRFVSFHDVHHLEVGMMALFCAIAYYLCDLLELSGILGLFVASRVAGSHAVYNCSRTARETAPFVFKFLASVSETAVFFLLGTSLWAFDSVFNGTFILGVILACLISRLFVIFPLCYLANLKRTIEVISTKMQVFMWFAGLRGAIAFGLIVVLHGKAGKGQLGPVSPEITGALLTATLMTILFTVLIMGAAAQPLLCHLGLDEPNSDEIEFARMREESVARDLDDDFPELRGLGWLLKTIEKRFIEEYVRRKPEDFVGVHKHRPHSVVGGGTRSRRATTAVEEEGGDPNTGEGNELRASQQEGQQQQTSASGYGAIPSSTHFGETGSRRTGTRTTSRGRQHRYSTTTGVNRSHYEWGGLNARKSTRHTRGASSGEVSALLGNNNNNTRTATNANAVVPVSSTSSAPPSSTTLSNEQSPSSSVVANAPGVTSSSSQNNQQQHQQHQQSLLGADSSHPHHHDRRSPRHSAAHSGWQEEVLAIRESRWRESHAGAVTSSTGQQQQQQAAAAAGATTGQQQQSAVMSGGIVSHDDGSDRGSDTDSFEEGLEEYNPHERPYEFSRLF